MEKNKLFLQLVRQKSGRSIFTIAAFVFVIAFSINLMLIVFFDYNKNYFRVHEELNGGHSYVVVSGFDEDEVHDAVEGVLKANKKISDYEIGKVLYFNGYTLKDGEKEYADYGVFNKDIYENSRQGRAIIEDEDPNIKGGIYLPYTNKVKNEYAIGDTFTFSINGSKEYNYPVAGFYYTVLYGDSACNLAGLLLPEEEYLKVAEDVGIEDIYASIRLYEPEKYAKSINSQLHDEIIEAMPGATLQVGKNYQAIGLGKNNGVSMYAAIIGCATLIIILVACVMVVSTLTAFVRDNMKMIGILKAVGYTGKEMNVLLTSSFQMFNAIAIVLGLGATYLSFGTFNKYFEKEVGIPYHIHVLWGASVIGGLCILVLLMILMTKTFSRIEQIDPVMAIVTPPNVQKAAPDALSLRKSKFEVNTAFGIMNAVTNIKQTIVVLVTVTVSAILLGFVIMLATNFIYEENFLKDVSFGYHSDVCITVQNTNLEKTADKLINDSRVENVFIDDEVQGVDVDTGEVLTISVARGSGELPFDSLLVEGDFPTRADSVIIGARYAYDNNLRIGDYITLKCEDSPAQYQICGYSQYIFLNGKTVIMTPEGFEKIGDTPIDFINVILKKGYSIDEFISELEDNYSIVEVNNTEATFDSLIGTYMTSIKAIMYLICLASLAVSIVALYSNVDSIIASRMRDFGIMKALGYTSKNLIKQTLITAIIPIIVGIILGLVLAAKYAAGVFNTIAFAMGLSIVSVPMKIYSTAFVLTGLGILGIMIIFGLFLSRKKIVNIDALDLISAQ